MAIQSFCISIEISEEEKSTVVSTIKFKRYKKSSNLTYKDVLYLDNVSLNESWLHINVGLYDFFHNCEILYELCKAIEIVKPSFAFYLLGEKHEFNFENFLDFVLFIYPKIEKHKNDFESYYGVLSVLPNNFFDFYKKNKRIFKTRETGDDW